MATPVWIGLGSNLGDRRAILDEAIAQLSGFPGISVRAVSFYHETHPIGGPPGQGSFLNAAAQLETTLDPYQLLALLQEIENQAGRVRVVRWGERTLDLDILIFGTKFLDTQELKLPHPRMAFRRFVLAPLAEIAPQVVDTMTKRTVADLLANLDRKPRLLALEGSSGGMKAMIRDRLINRLPALAILESDVIDEYGEPLEHDRFGFDKFEIKAAALTGQISGPDPNSHDWIVADYCPRFDREQVVSSALAELRRAPDQLPERSIYQGIYAGIRRVDEAANRTWTPTLAVLLPGTHVVRSPARADFPLLRPEGESIESIVAEIIATCRGIECV